MQRTRKNVKNERTRRERKQGEIDEVVILIINLILREKIDQNEIK